MSSIIILENPSPPASLSSTWMSGQQQRLWGPPRESSDGEAMFGGRRSEATSESRIRNHSSGITLRSLGVESALS